MGIPKFFRFISERYPCILELIRESEIPDFDNLYLDMNGIFHNSLGKNSNETLFNISEKDVFQRIFDYIDILFNIIRPKKLLFMAVDGVAPRAKMNQQRARRFRTARDRELMLKKMAANSEKLPVEGCAVGFDSNCISPGTEFMARLQSQLEYFVTNRITNYEHWRSCKVILSGHQVPGEGEHKIMEYIRYMKTLPDYDPYTRHCFYGLDADLLILGLCTHEINISILREEVIKSPTLIKTAKYKEDISKIIMQPSEKNFFMVRYKLKHIIQGPRPNIERKAVKFGRQVSTQETKFYLLHLSLLKEYLDLEFRDLKSSLSFEYDLDCIVDDWILMGFILGNDFIPHLPHFHIAKGALDVLYKAYIDVLPTLGGYLNEKGYLNLSRFQIFMERLAKHELESFEETYANLAYLEEKTGRRGFSEKSKENHDDSKDPELETLIAATNEALGFSEDDDDLDDLEDDNEDELFFKEFSQHKRDYYTNKMDYFEVTDEVLKSQAEGYIRGIQWILHYYYHGCKSWSWFYPHHYAPCTSDIINFKDVNLDFDLGQPFLPYQQLLAIMPPASKDLLPKAYHDLMISANSPIKSYYPDNFETDLNGKQHEWEAVVLLPFIDVKDLFNAMESCNSNLTQEEKRLNSHGPMLIYSYVPKNLGKYKAPNYFPDLPENYASVQVMWRSEIAVDNSHLNLDKRRVDQDYFFPGFPTFRYVSFEVNKEKKKVRVFDQTPRSESIILSINEVKIEETEKLAKELLGKNIYVNWPFLQEARVLAISDRKKHFQGDRNGEVQELTDEEISYLSEKILSMTRNLTEKFGIEIGQTEVVVYVNVLKGVQRIFDKSGNMTIKKVWSDAADMYPLQTLVKSVSLYGPHSPESRLVGEVFSVGSDVFMLGFPFYGCMGQVVSGPTKAKNNKVRVKLQVPTENRIDRELLSHSMTAYYSASAAGQRIGISPMLLAKISGSVLVDQREPGQMPQKKSVVNIGLRLKFTKWNEEVPGYTKKEGFWMYSDKAIEVIKEYITRYATVTEYLSKHLREPSQYQRRDIFPGPNGAADLEGMLKWLSGLECNSVRRVSCGSQILEKDIVLEMEKIVDSSPKEITVKHILVKPQLLFKGDLLVGRVPPIEKADHQLFDRIISVQRFRNIPLGLRGHIIGIIKGENTEDCMYDILYDEPIPSGMTLNCSPGRGYRTSSASFINISYGERSCQLSKHSKPHLPEISPAANPPNMLGTERPSSAFAQWNNHPPVSASKDQDDQFKSLWSYLEKVKSQDETEVLKKILKIEDEEKPKIEDNVKTFFENISKNTMNFKSGIVATENVKILLQSNPDNQCTQQFSNHLKLKNLPLPNYQKLDSGDKLGCQITHQDSSTLMELPNADKSAQKALHALAELKRGKEPAIRKESETDQKTVDNQARLDKALLKANEVDRNSEPAKWTIKQRATSEKSVKSNKTPHHQQNQRGNNVPYNLPTPPLQWCRQSRTSAHADRYRNSPSLHNEDYRQATGGKTEYFNSVHSQDGFDNRSKTDLVGKNVNNRQDCCKTDHPNTARNQKNHSIEGRQRVDSSNGFRNSWRQEEKTKAPQGDSRPGNESARNWRLRLNKTDQFVRLWPENIPIRQGNAQKSAADNSQVGQNGACQRGSGLATEFIPLQALARSRSRGTNQSKPQKEVKVTEEPVPPPSKPLKLGHEASQVYKPSSNPKRRSKIAAKFDAEWDPVD